MCKRGKTLSLLLVIIFTMFSITGCKSIDNTEQENLMLVHYIDVGQGDSILIQVNDKNMLIDAGPGSSEDELVKYLYKNKIKKLDYIIATHPHEDHIGGMDEVIKKFGTKEFYAPRVYTDSKAFNNMVNDLNKKNIKLQEIVGGMGKEFDLGEGTNVEIYSPLKGIYEDLNNYSPIIKVSFGETSFVFTGDAEIEGEAEALSSGSDLEADVLKIGHHGSNSSTSEEFLERVNPEKAVISVGKGNKFNHPTEETINKLHDRNIETLRTDKEGTIKFKTDGQHVEVDKSEKSESIITHIIDFVKAISAIAPAETKVA